MCEEKERLYKKLVEERQQCRLCGPVMKNPYEAYDKKGNWLEPHQLDDWANWQGGLDADILLIGQEWGDIEGYIRSGNGNTEYSETNENLIKLFRHIGIIVERQETGIKNPMLFFTNAALCLKVVDKNAKKKGAQGKTNPLWYHNCVPFIIGLIQIVRPKIIITLGKEAYIPLAELFGFPADRYSRLSDVIGLSPNGFDINLIDYSATLFPVYHVSAQVINTSSIGRGRSWKEMLDDWGRIKGHLISF